MVIEFIRKQETSFLSSTPTPILLTNFFNKNGSEEYDVLNLGKLLRSEKYIHMSFSVFVKYTPNKCASQDPKLVLVQY